MMKILSALLVGVLLFGSLDAEAAKRMGGGGSFGRQSSNVTQRQAAPQAPASAPQNAGQNNAAARPGTPAATPPAAAPRRPWAGMLGGLAAGLGLAWLAHSLGMGGAFGQMLMFLLLAGVVVFAISMFMRRRNPGNNGNGYAFQGAGASPASAEAPSAYNPAKVGNDASARPWEAAPAAFDSRPAAGGVVIGSGLGQSAASSQSALSGSQSWGVPEGFDTEGFLTAAKRNFVLLQDAWDRADIPTLRTMMTDSMVEEIRVQLNEREAQSGGKPNKTEVVMLESTLLGIEDAGADYLASVEFSGVIREDPSAGPSPFREVWNMAKPKDGKSGWLVAGVQALQ
ncbi:TIM44-like domain-containing protein [Xylophilus rhododendri]|uniref:TIM44-like domain-containing protein n=1 Tax=Xylophilus rhododendri TaxID=2697032 RepID=A0A857J464_9BURK|nr:Tim44-like domain-containing protein [Xylophilus rhododendri]QHI97841.1 TIM44-like domain-containing protein [Xylophilus rhododendri]